MTEPTPGTWARAAVLALLSACLLGSGSPESPPTRPPISDATSGTSSTPAVGDETPVPPESSTGNQAPAANRPKAKRPPAPARNKATAKDAAGADATPSKSKKDATPKAGSSAASVDRVLDDVQKHYDKIQDLRASFVQESSVASMGRKDVSNGTVAVKRPGRMRWEYTTPEARVLLLDGQTVKMYSPAEKQLQVAPLDPKTFSPTALTFLLGTGDLRETFTAELMDPSGRPPGAPEIGLRLHPKSDASFEYLELWLTSGKWTLRESVVVDLFGNRTSVRFADVAENAQVPEKAFQLEVPAGTETIDLR